MRVRRGVARRGAGAVWHGGGAVWRASRAAVRRRRVQTFVLGVVVFCSTVAIVVALGLLESVSAPFERAFEGQRGAHVVASYDPGRVTRAALAARPRGVEAVAGPFAQAVVTIPETFEHLPPGPLTVVGRSSPGGPVDRLDLWAGRWPARPGEIVLDRPANGFFSFLVGVRFTVREGQAFTVVGLASSVSRSSEAWVTPGQAAALRPAATQLLYRLHAAGTDAQVRAGTAAIAAGLPAGALLGSQSYLVVQRDAGRAAAAFLPFLTVFGVLGLVVAVLIAVNVVSGAVVAGHRHIGLLKALGFTPNQVVAVYLTMVLVPAVAGAALGTAAGAVAARPLLDDVGAGVFTATTSPWVYAATLAGMPAVAVLAALVPALRAHRLTAARAISAGAPPGRGRGLRVQRLLAGAPLPRPVSLGLGLPFARPGRAALTLAAVVLGAATVTLATGLSMTMTSYGAAAQRVGHVHTVVHAGQARNHQTPPRHGDAGIEALLRGLPGAMNVTADAWVTLHLAGHPQPIQGRFLRGDSGTLGETLVEGRWLRGRGEVVAPSAFLVKRGLAVGDRLTLSLGRGRAEATVVGATMDGAADLIQADWHTLTALAPDQRATQYEVRLAPGTGVESYNAAVRAADPGLHPVAKSTSDPATVAVIGFASLLTVLLGTVAALGVLNTVVLDARERRRDIGVLKSIGMTPRQVTVMMVTSMAALGAAGGLLGVPVGVAAHRLVVPAMAEAAGIALPAFMVEVWRAPLLALLTPAGVVIAVLGALVPARSAARQTIATVLHNE
ncbi:putative ABC transport system permease protein [Nonomuraea thailandensis]|uniref:ABC transport system permease protein n=1 Tax=Nonomuraea thailandensis TaxID=1188745 RepID=A0A9X2GLU1_9ACTN|nr:FtsX-like permease family protein [Nonomuraea thailandensis]MCP2357871.1 putative ABC transport system permease protein [Nonomuraea thailandensis]